MKYFFIVFCFFISLASLARLVEKTQAQVNQSLIFLTDFKSFKKAFKQKLLFDSVLLKQVFSSKKLLRNKNSFLEFLISRQLVAQASEQVGIPEPSKLVQLRAFKKITTGLTRQALVKKLRNIGWSLDMFKKELAISLKNDLYLNQFVLSKILISNQAIGDYYFNLHKSSLFDSFEYEFISVSFKKEKKLIFFKKLASSKAKNLKKFAKSLGLKAKNLKLKEKDLHKDLKKELDKLAISQISQALIFGDLYYVLQLKWKYPQTSIKNLKQKKKIELVLYKKQAQKEIKKWINKQKTTSFVLQKTF